MSNISYPNLRAEMARRNISVKQLAETLGVNRDTVTRKLSKRSPLYLDEAFQISKILFPDIDFNYLFENQQIA